MYISKLICMVMFDIQYLIITCFNGYMYISNYLLNNDLPCFNKLLFFFVTQSRVLSKLDTPCWTLITRDFTRFLKKKLLPGCIGKKKDPKTVDQIGCFILLTIQLLVNFHCMQSALKLCLKLHNLFEDC